MRVDDPRGLTLLATAALALIVLAYANHFDNAFHFDDSHVIVDNTYIRDIANVPLFFTDPSTKSTLPTNRAYRPVLMASFAIDYWIAGSLDPFYFHLSTFLWFLAQGVLMYLLFARILDATRPDPANRMAAILMTAFYCLHTANAETINYVTARSDSLSTFFTVLVVLMLGSRNRASRWLSVAPLIIGVLVKPTTVMAVPLALLYRMMFLHQLGPLSIFRREAWLQWKNETLLILPTAVVAAAAFWLTLYMTPDTWAPGGQSAWNYLITQPWVMLRYFWTFFLPIGLSADSDWVPLQTLMDWRFVAGITFVMIAAIFAVLAAERRNARPVAFGLMWFFLTLLPSSSVIPLAEVTNDHRMFFPFVGLTLAVGWIVWRGLARINWTDRPLAKAAIALLGCGVFSAHAWGVHVRNEVWHSDESLWRDVAEKSPANGRGLMNYGLAHMARARYEQALEYFHKARETAYGRHPYLFTNIGIATNAMGQTQQAGEWHRQALAIGAAYPEVHVSYARWLRQQGKLVEAQRHISIALKLAPGHSGAKHLQSLLVSTPGTQADVHLDQSLQHYQAGNYSQSLQSAEKALQLQPDSALAYNNLCVARIKLGQLAEAVSACQEAVRLAPNLAIAQNNLRWASDELAAQSESEQPSPAPQP